MDLGYYSLGRWDDPNPMDFCEEAVGAGGSGIKEKKKFEKKDMVQKNWTKMWFYSAFPNPLSPFSRCRYATKCSI